MIIRGAWHRLSSARMPAERVGAPLTCSRSDVLHRREAQTICGPTGLAGPCYQSCDADCLAPSATSPPSRWADLRSGGPSQRRPCRKSPLFAPLGCRGHVYCVCVCKVVCGCKAPHQCPLADHSLRNERLLGIPAQRVCLQRLVPAQQILARRRLRYLCLRAPRRCHCRQQAYRWLRPCALWLQLRESCLVHVAPQRGAGPLVQSGTSTQGPGQPNG